MWPAKKNSKELNSKFGDFFQKEGYCDRIFPFILFLHFGKILHPTKMLIQGQGHKNSVQSDDYSISSASLRPQLISQIFP
jgi:hypothetical protein